MSVNEILGTIMLLGMIGVIFIGFPIAIAATLISAAWLAALRVPGVHDLGGARSIRVLALAVFAVLTGMGLFALANDLSNVL